MKETNDEKKVETIKETEDKKKINFKKINLKNVVIVSIGIAVVLIVLILIICFFKPKSNDELPIWDTTPINAQVNLEEIFEEIEKIEGMSNTSKSHELERSGDKISNSSEEETDGNLNRENQTTKEEKPEDEIDFGKYEDLEMKAIVNTTDNTINEVWMIKLGNLNQQEEVCRILGRRIQKLKNAFREDEVQTRILNEAIIKQENGIVIMIISPNDNEIEKTIGKLMSEA